MKNRSRTTTAKATTKFIPPSIHDDEPIGVPFLLVEHCHHLLCVESAVAGVPRSGERTEGLKVHQDPLGPSCFGGDIPAEDGEAVRGELAVELQAVLNRGDGALHGLPERGKCTMKMVELNHQLAARETYLTEASKTYFYDCKSSCAKYIKQHLLTLDLMHAAAPASSVRSLPVFASLSTPGGMSRVIREVPPPRTEPRARNRRRRRQRSKVFLSSSCPSEASSPFPLSFCLCCPGDPFFWWSPDSQGRASTSRV